VDDDSGYPKYPCVARRQRSRGLLEAESLDTMAIYTRPSEEDMAAAVETLAVE